MLAALLCAAWAGAANLTLSPVVAPAGQTATLELRISEALEPYIGYNARIELPAGVAVTNFEAGPLIPGEFELDVHTYAENDSVICGILAYSTSESALPGDGVLGFLTLQVSDDLDLLGLATETTRKTTISFVESGLASVDGVTSLDHTSATGVMYLSRETVSLLDVTPPDRSVSLDAGTASFQVLDAAGIGFNWQATVTSGGDWASITAGDAGADGDAIEVTYSANESGVLREATIVVDAGAGVLGSPTTLTLRQAGTGESTLSVTPEQLTLPALSGLATLDVTNTGDEVFSWSAQVISGNDWLTIDSGAQGEGSGEIVLMHPVNPGALARTAVVQITVDGAAAIGPILVNVTQEPPTVLHATPAAQVMPAAGGMATIDVSNAGSGDMPWTAEIVSGIEWLTLTDGGAGVNSGQIEVTAADNVEAGSRTAVIRITALGALNSPAEAVVIQAGNETPLLHVFPEEQTVDSDAGMAEFDVVNGGNGTLNWTTSITDGASWLQLNAGMNGVNAGVIRVSFTRNPVSDERTATLLVTAEGADNSPMEITIRQRGSEPLQLTSPNGSENWRRGETQDITWTSAEDTGIQSVSLLLLKGGQVHATIAMTTNNTGAYEWTVPDDLTPASNYRIQIIDVSDINVHDASDATFAVACPPDVPENVQASDGLPGGIEVTWDAVDSATEYELYRSNAADSAGATLLTTTSALSYQDLDTLPPDVSGLQCNNTETVQFHKVYYWVKAVNHCNASPFSASDEGYRGQDDAKIRERAFPTARIAGEDVRYAAPDDTLYVRIASDHAIDAGSLWGHAESAGVEQPVYWIALSDRDGWAAASPAHGTWVVGETITVTAGATTVDGEALGPITQRFVIVDDENKDVRESADDAIVTELAEQDLPVLEHAIGAVYVVGPDRVFESPRRVLIPLSEDLHVSDVAIQYYFDDELAGGWYSADRVDGWLVEDSIDEVAVDGVRYVRFEILHGGIVQLTRVPAPHEAAMLPTSALRKILSGDVLGVMLAMGVLLLTGVRRKRVA